MEGKVVNGVKGTCTENIPSINGFVSAIENADKLANGVVVKGAGKSAAKGVNGAKVIGVNFNNVSKRANKSVNYIPNADIKAISVRVAL